MNAGIIHNIFGHHFKDLIKHVLNVLTFIQCYTDVKKQSKHQRIVMGCLGVRRRATRLLGSNKKSFRSFLTSGRNQPIYFNVTSLVLNRWTATFSSPTSIKANRSRGRGAKPWVSDGTPAIADERSPGYRRFGFRLYADRES